MNTAFNLIIIGDEILHGTRTDKHFAFFKSMLEQHGLKLNQVQYLPDEPDLLTKQLHRSFADGLPTFVTGGIGATPDDHTRQAAAEALGVPLVRHAEAAEIIDGVTLGRGEGLDSAEHRRRLMMADFPEGAALIPNPFNKIAGFSVREHYFLPGFPVMAHPMAQWVLDTYYADRFHQTARGSRHVYVFRQPESRIAPLMQWVEEHYPEIRSFSLPSVGWTNADGQTVAPHIEFGIKAEGAAVAQLDGAWEALLEKLHDLGAEWKDRAE
ncbi:competence/damage-inducible protein A [Neisseria animalis]|uniref:Competence/damage-inducible protein A n=1 Tax=Neisseria animalis TaxID=492 RepID=A0A5P3MR69_NEIAN|nr:molybdopterin-binding protein [Neisseria animalis]QEY24096.1 competence/damage-inducible protein A [Neisseria animalis]ROW32664.1 competence/damage-inducible protein A [Neisseria animalis]VEE06272.1 CinA-like protein [Neisseria animalis]